MKNKYTKYFATTILLIAISFVAFGQKQKAFAPTECIGTVNLTGTQPVFIGSTCDAEYKFVTLTRRADPNSQKNAPGHISYDVALERIIVWSDNPNDFGSIDYKIEK